MEATGKIIVVYDAEGGISKRTGNSWKKQEFVLETIEQYKKKIPFEVFGEERIKNFNLQLNDVVTIKFDVDSSEYKGKYYAKCTCFGIERQGQQPAQQQAQAAQPAPQAAKPAPQPAPQPATQATTQQQQDFTPTEGNSDDLPF